MISLVYGLPTVIGGVNGGQFISSMEQFDKSEKSIDAPFQREWNIINQVASGSPQLLLVLQVLTSPRYEHTVASIPASKVFSFYSILILNRLKWTRENCWLVAIQYILQMKSCKDEEEGDL